MRQVVHDRDQTGGFIGQLHKLPVIDSSTTTWTDTMTSPILSERPQILQIGRLMPVLEGWLRERYSLTVLDEIPDPGEFLKARGADFWGVATSALYGVSAEQLAALPNLRIVSCFGVGVDKIAMEVTRARGIKVGYTPDILNDCVADIAFALMPFAFILLA